MPDNDATAMAQRTLDAAFTFDRNMTKSSSLEEDLVAMQLVRLQAPAEQQAYARKLELEKKIFREEGRLWAQRAVLQYFERKATAYGADTKSTQDEIHALDVEHAALTAYLKMKQ